ncbi:MAG TPA: thermonuclease family protein [Rhizomicrobium sp.]|jgi:endonuclease YncB( thermonuclease family)|nr:thermonuclease family protein [Rhizomicrobium sp.]
MRILTYGAILAAMCLSLDAYAADASPAGDEHFIPDCAGSIVIAHARVARVNDDGALILTDGRMLRLEGIRLPLADKSVSGQVLAALRDIVRDRTVSFTTAAPDKDRYGRMRAQGFGKQWLQMALLEQGLARVQIAPDRSECAPDLHEAEAAARARHAGIWAKGSYRVRGPGELKDATGTFQLVEGLVSNIGHADGRTFIDFGAPSDDRRLFSVVIGAESRNAFRDFDFDELSGRRIRVRGIVQDYRGRPEIVLSNPAQIELLDN